MFKITTSAICVALLFCLPACDLKSPGTEDQAETTGVKLIQAGWLDASDIKEASGIQASFSQPGTYFVHNDDAPPLLYVIDSSGNDLGAVYIEPAKITDWEDITSVPVDGKRWIVAGNIGDNFARREYISLYFAEEPQPDSKGFYSGSQLLQHRIDLTYPDGPRDCESLAYDPSSQRLLFLSKRDKPARLYAIDLAVALQEHQAELEFLGTIAPLRPPTKTDMGIWSNRAVYISQPTGFDISPDGTEAAIITYRSIYRFKRQDGEDWLTALQREPQEVVGPPAPQNEAVAYSPDGKHIFVTSENIPTPLYRFTFSDPE